MIIQTENKQDTTWKFRYGIIYLFAFSIVGAILIVLGPLIPIKSRDGGLEETEYSVVFTLRGIGYASGSFIVARLEKSYKAHKMMALAIFIMGIMSFLNVSEVRVYLNSLEWCFIGVGCGFMEVLTQVSITVIYPEQINKWMQILHFGFGIGAFVSPLFSTMLGKHSMDVIGILCVVSAILIYLQPSPKDRQIQIHSESQIEIKPQPPTNLIRALSVFFFLDIGFELSYGGWIPTFCTMTGITNQKQAGISSSIFWLAMTAGRLICIPLANKFKVQMQLKFFSWTNIVIVLFCLFMLATNNLIILVYLGSLFVGLGLSGIYPLLMSIPGAFGFNLSAANTAIFTVSASTGQALLPVFSGFLINIFGPKALFVKYAFVILLMLYIYHEIIKHEPKKDNSNNLAIELSLISH